MQSWKTLSRETVFQQGKWLTVENHRVELPDGAVIEDWSWVKTPDFVNVVLITDDEQFVLFKQTKYAVEGETLAPVGGYLEPDENPLEAAKRETLEETGYRAPLWVDLGQYAVDGNRGAGTAYAFLGLRAAKVAEPDADDLEEQTLILLSRGQVETALFNGDFKVLPWANIIALALLYLNQQDGF